MKTVTVRDLQKKGKACVDGAQADPVFWKLVRTRRKQPTISLGQLKQRLGLRTT